MQNTSSIIMMFAIVIIFNLQRRLLSSEEEDMVCYSSNDLKEDWEFKILHARVSFKDKSEFARICEEEGRAGWVFLEKLDDHRLRFKRPIAARSNDSRLDFDPYRSIAGHYSILQDRRVWAIIGFIVTAVATTYLLGSTRGVH